MATTPLQQAEAVLSSLEELVPDPSIDFGPAYSMAGERQNEAIAIMQAVIRQIKTNQGVKP